jgi:hypothetical protein
MNWLGYACGHEWVYNFRPEHRWAGLRGDSAWPAAVLIDTFPPEWPIAHLVRDPIRVITSLHTSGFTNRKLENTPYMKYVRARLPAMNQIRDDLTRAVALVWMWNRVVEQKSEGHFSRRFRIEDISTDPEALVRFSTFLTGVVPSTKVAEEVLEIIPRNYNTHRRGSVVWSNLPEGMWRDRLVEMTLEYGYTA